MIAKFKSRPNFQCCASMQGVPFYPPQPAARTAGAGVPYPPQGDQAGQGLTGAHLAGEQTLPTRVLNTRIRSDNPW